MGHIPLIAPGHIQSEPLKCNAPDTTTTDSCNRKAMDPESSLGKVLAARIRVQKQEGQCRSTSMFTRNLNEALDLRRSSNNFFITISNLWQVSNAVDFSSNDILALGSSGRLRNETLQELSNNPDLLFMGSGGSRVIDGNYTYIEEAEEHMASFFNAEAGLILNSGYEANVAIWTAIPRLGDVIVHDTLVHASTFEGMKQSLAVARKEFSHNDVRSFRDTLLTVADQYPQVKQGKRCILVAVESVYSMDGDVCPLHDLVLVAKDVFPGENVQFVVDEAHGTGVLGHQGRGLVAALGLEGEIAVRLHTFGKALAAGGAIVLGSRTVRSALVNFAKSVTFSTAPSFLSVAAMRAGINLLARGATESDQDHVESLVRHFLEKLTTHEMWDRARKVAQLSLPLADEGWCDQLLVTHIVPIRTQDPYHYWLYFHLIFAGFTVFPVSYPTVPKGQTRLKVTFHSNNTEEQVNKLVDSIFEFVAELTYMQDNGGMDHGVPSAARSVYDWMAKERLVGFGSQ